MLQKLLMKCFALRYYKYIFISYFNTNVVLSGQWYICKSSNISTANAVRCNNCDDLANLSFILKVSVFSEAYLEPS